MTTPPLRCHLLIGPPASGKTTLAAVLAQSTGAILLSTDSIRAELYSDEAVQGPWREIEALLHQRLKDAVAAGKPVILDGTHSQRPWRLAILQALELPAPVQWIGWWLTTPLEQCLTWNQQRQRQVDEGVIRRQLGFLPNGVYEPPETTSKKLPADPVERREKLKDLRAKFMDRQRSQLREEGFASVVAIDPSSGSVALSQQIEDELRSLDCSIQMAGSRKSKVDWHRYSRLLDFERLIYLIRLLLEFPGIELADSSVEKELRASFRYEPDAPLPDDEELGFASRAAYALHHRHGPCYGDEDAVAKDLQWLLEQKFVSLADLPVTEKVIPGPACERVQRMKEVGAGFPAAAHEPVFQRQLGLLRHLIQNPFEHPTAPASSDQDPSETLGGESLKPLEQVVREARKPREADVEQGLNLEGKTNKRKSKSTRAVIPSLRVFLLKRLEELDVADYSSKRKRYSDWDFQPDAPQLRTLDKDIELLIKGYGFTTINQRNHGEH